jgi:hypothetical protein
VASFPPESQVPKQLWNKAKGRIPSLAFSFALSPSERPHTISLCFILCADGDETRERLDRLEARSRTLLGAYSKHTYWIIHQTRTAKTLRILALPLTTTAATASKHLSPSSVRVSNVQSSSSFSASPPPSQPSKVRSGSCRFHVTSAAILLLSQGLFPTVAGRLSECQPWTLAWTLAWPSDCSQITGIIRLSSRS